MPNSPKPLNPVISMTAFLGIVAVLFVFVILLTYRPVQHIEHAHELDGFDFGAGLAYILPGAFERFPDALYYPADFAAGLVSPTGESAANPHFSTYRLMLELQEGVVYGLSGYSATHAMALWVDGSLLARAGVPGDSLQSTVPGTNYFAVYFTAGEGPTEIIVQRSSFVLVHGGRLNPFYLGEQALITEMNTLTHTRISMVIGVTFMAALLNLGIFMFFKNRTRFLWFSLVCLMIALRTLGIDNRLLATLMPGLDWHVDYIIGYLSTSAFIISLTLYTNAMFRNMLRRFITLPIVTGLVLHSVFILVMPSTVYSMLQIPYNIFIMAFSAAVLVNICLLAATNRAMRHSEHILVLAGVAANVLLGLVEGIVRSLNPQIPHNLTQIGALVFMFLNIIALALYFDRTERELAIANEERRRLEADEIRLTSDNAALESLSRMKSEYIANMSHEAKAPLTVISVHVQRAAELYEESIFADKRILESLRRVQEEIKRVARIADTSLGLASMQSRDHMEPLDIRTLLANTVELNRLRAEKKGNSLIFSAAEDLPQIHGNADRLIGVVTNLLNNSIAFTQEGRIGISAKEEHANIRITVKDTGTGIAPELLPKIFERGVSGAGGTGFGLAICKGIIEAHSGTIEIES